MSRLGKKPISIPSGVEVKQEGGKVIVKGPKGELSREIRPEIKVEIKDKEIIVSPKIETKKTGAYWGLTRSLIFNMIEGVVKGYEKKLKIQGLGYKASMKGKNLVLKVGFSHPVEVEEMEGIEMDVKGNIITVSGISKEKVGLRAAQIRKVKPPEPYKGKGIRYLDEQVKRKVGKRVAGEGAMGM
jgi:large subunit ribosomal protein L6